MYLKRLPQRLTNNDSPGSPPMPSMCPTYKSSAYGGLNGSNGFCLVFSPLTLDCAFWALLFVRCRLWSGDESDAREARISVLACSLLSSAGQQQMLNWNPGQ